MSEPTGNAAPEGYTTVSPRVVTDLLDDAFGRRGGRIRDPFGDIWWVTAVVEEVAEGEIRERLGRPVYADAMRVAQEPWTRS